MTTITVNFSMLLISMSAHRDGDRGTYLGEAHTCKIQCFYSKESSDSRVSTSTCSVKDYSFNVKNSFG